MATIQPTRKQQTSVTLSQEAKRLLMRLSKKLSVSRSAILELAIRRMAEHEGVK